MSAPRLTVLTAALPARLDHLSSTGQWVLAARDHLPLEWILVSDGEPTAPQREHLLSVGADRVVVMGHAGVSAARNRALSLATTPVVFPLDADDGLQPEGLLKALDILDTDGELGWVAPNRLLLDGSRTPHWHEERTWAVGQLAEHWSAPFPFHPNTIVVRTSCAVAAGGWDERLDVNEDLAFALMCSEVAPGRSIEQVATLYRTWEGQVVAGDDYPARKQRAFDVIEPTLNRARATHGRHPVCPPRAGGAYGRLAGPGGGA